MKVFSVCGITQSGKTTTMECIIGELTRRGYRVGSVKEIHFDAFAIDPDPTSNTHRHRAAGAGLVCARGHHETDFLFPGKLPMDKILDVYEGQYDYVALEGVADIPVPTIVAAHGTDDMDAKWNEHTFCAAGRVSAQMDAYRGVPVFDARTQVQPLVDLIERVVYDRLPNVSAECCNACQLGCSGLGREILRGNRQRSECVADQGAQLFIDGRRIHMVPFVQRILRNAVLGVAGELDGYQQGAAIEVRLDDVMGE